MGENEVEPDPLVEEFVRFADRKGRGELAREWAAKSENLAGGRLAATIMSAGNKRNAFRSLLKEAAKCR